MELHMSYGLPFTWDRTGSGLRLSADYGGARWVRMASREEEELFDALPAAKLDSARVGRGPYDYAALPAFFGQPALRQLTKPSCLVCGRNDFAWPPAIQHAELLGVVVCHPCRDARAYAVEMRELLRTVRRCFYLGSPEARTIDAALAKNPAVKATDPRGSGAEARQHADTGVEGPAHKGPGTAGGRGQSPASELTERFREGSALLRNALFNMDALFTSDGEFRQIHQGQLDLALGEASKALAETNWMGDQFG